jgi:hypothetical protein
MRKPIVVALANYFFPGLGYILLGQRVLFGYIVMSAAVIQMAQLIVEPLPYIVTYGSTPIVVALGFLAIFVLQLAFACDAYQLAKATK